MTSTTAEPAVAVPWWILASRVIKAYVALTKPRIIELLLVTTLPTMLLAADGWPGLWLMVATLVGGALSAGSANTFNSYIDRDIDTLMKRTRDRPLVTGRVKPWKALVFAWVLAAVSTAWFWFVVDSPLATALSVVAILLYVVFYTMLLKRRTSQNIVWGGAAGCMPVLIAWAAVTERLDWAPVALFMVIFLWTPPHYWPLSMKFKNDYENAHVPMLPVVSTTRHVAGEMIAYAFAMVAATIALVFLVPMTWVYLTVAVAAGVWFVTGCFALWDRARRDDVKLREMRLFRDSITYLTIVFIAVGVDPFIHDSLTVWAG